MKLLNNFYQVGGQSLSYANDATSYLLGNESEGFLLIDCGSPDGYGKLLANIKKLGFHPRQIKAILGTHGHYDHVGAAALFQRDFGTKFYLHEADAARVEKGDDVKTTASFLYGKEFPPCVVDGFICDGQHFDSESYTLEAIHTPGHTPGSVCFVAGFQGVIVLIAGDTIFGGYSERTDSNVENWKRSLERICSRHYDSFVFGHGSTVLHADADARLLEAKMSFANYFNPWFKDFKNTYKY